MTLTDLRRLGHSWAEVDQLVELLAEATDFSERGDNFGHARRRLDVIETRIARLIRQRQETLCDERVSPLRRAS